MSHDAPQQPPSPSPASPRFAHAGLDEPLIAPAPGFMAAHDPNRGSLYSASNRESSGWASRTSLNEERGLLGTPLSPTNPAAVPLVADAPPVDKEYASDSPAQRTRRKWLIPLVAGLVLLVVIIIAVVVAVYFTVIKPHSANANPGSGSATSTAGSSAPSASATPTVLVSGGDGSTVTTESGSTFVYKNSFGGYWYQDPADPMGGAGRANSWTPPVNESWPWGKQNINGVNLGGWLVLEPFIAPAPFQKYQGGDFPVVDEWTLSMAMAADTSPGGGLSQIEDHYKTFITEQDFAEIAGAGLTWVRIPVPFWAISKLPAEPYLEGVAWTYLLKAIGWARKYGLRINLDLHTIPGSQNGWNHSGKLGSINWLQGVMGYANAQRAMDYIRVYAEFISQPEITNVVPMFGVVNEPRNIVDIHNIKRFYYQLYTMIRGITGIGKGPVISFHTGFSDNSYGDWLPRADRIMIDRHPYIIFSNAPSNRPPASYASQPCNGWGDWANNTAETFGLYSHGEFSAAINDCGLWVNSVGGDVNYENSFGKGSCDEWNNWEAWSDDRKAGLQTFVEASMDSLQNWFFWTWRIGESSTDKKVVTPFWSYKLGLDNGWMPKDPRSVSGKCDSLGFDQNSPFDGKYSPWQTSGEGATLTPTTTEDYSWPPPTLVDQPDVDQLPMYTPTGALPTLAMPTGATGNGWFNAQDTRGLYVPIEGCKYPDPWNANDVPIPPRCA